MRRPVSERDAVRSQVIDVLRAQQIKETGKNGKKRAIIATARKLAVLLHRLWVSGEVYEPLHNSKPIMATAA